MTADSETAERQRIAENMDFVDRELKRLQRRLEAAGL